MNNFQCKQCGNCCKLMYLPLYSRDHMKWALNHNLRCFHIEGTDEFRVLIEKQCNFLLTDNKCLKYKDRPKMCKDYQCNKLKYKEVIL